MSCKGLILLHTVRLIRRRSHIIVLSIFVFQSPPISNLFALQGPIPPHNTPPFCSIFSLCPTCRSIFVSLYLFLSLSVFLTLCLCLCRSMSVSLFVCLFVFLSLFLCFCLCLSLCMRLCLSVSLAMPLSVC